MSQEFKVKFKTRNINSKRLFNEIKRMAEEVGNEYISSTASLLDDTYDYEELVVFFDLFFNDLMEKKKITQFDVVADQRNNDVVDIKKGIINLTVKFRQTNCINVTKIDMQFAVE